VSRRRPGSARWLAEHEADPYVKEARRLGLRSRAAFKLEEIDRRDGLLRPGMIVVDLGAAPGGWSQYARPRLGEHGRVIAIDLLEMEPLPGVEFVRGDFREAEGLAALNERLAGRSVDLVLSDMAPNVSGVVASDQAAGAYLVELAASFARERLKVGGSLLTKAFRGRGIRSPGCRSAPQFRAGSDPQAEGLAIAECRSLSAGAKPLPGVVSNECYRRV
jgi:23S rRNA Um-2552 2''-O-methyltransferase (EC 2.1.1.-)